MLKLRLGQIFDAVFDNPPYRFELVRCELGDRIADEWARPPLARRCELCHDVVRLGEPDPCLGWLPGVIYACCGHGREGYIAWHSGPIFRFQHRVIRASR